MPDGVLDESAIAILVFGIAALLLAIVVCVWRDRPHLFAQATKLAPIRHQPEKMTPQTRLLVMRSLQSERVFARIMLPAGRQGNQDQERRREPQRHDDRPAGCGVWCCCPAGRSLRHHRREGQGQGDHRRSERWIEEAPEVVSAHRGCRQCRWSNPDSRRSEPAEP